MTETSPLLPISPYGVTKLAAEQLGFLSTRIAAFPSSPSAFFTVYGPGQRPTWPFISSTSDPGRPEIPVFGDGSQTRDFTYVDDIVEALVAADGLVRTARSSTSAGPPERLSALFAIFEKITGRR
jgi:UDP-glucose 4-epimerase